MQFVSALALADRAITFRFGDAISPQIAAKVRAAARAISRGMDQGRVAGAVEVAQSFCAVTVHYDPLQTRHQDLVESVTALLDGVDADTTSEGREWLLPCRYDGMDLAALQKTLNMPVGQIVETHTATLFDVYALGFLPGLPFMGTLPDAMSLPRRATPRARVPRGAVAIANGLGVIYPAFSPGGWHILGHCPIPLFDVARVDRPALLAAGDRVRFRAVTPDECAEIEADIAAERLDPLGMQVAP